MAISYHLDLETSASPECLLARIDELREGHGLSARSGREAEPSATYHREDFGFASDVWMGFRFDWNQLSRAANTLIDCLARILPEGVSRAVLRFEGEIVVSWFEDGRTTFSSTFSVWTPERLARLGRPVERAPLLSPWIDWVLCSREEPCRPDLVHPDDLQALRDLSPAGRLFEVEALCGGFVRLRYGDQRYRVRPTGLVPRARPRHEFGASVVAPIGVGQVSDIFWDDEREEPSFLVTVQGERNTTRYVAQDLAPAADTGLPVSGPGVVVNP